MNPNEPNEGTIALDLSMHRNEAPIRTTATSLHIDVVLRGIPAPEGQHLSDVSLHLASSPAQPDFVIGKDIGGYGLSSGAGQRIIEESFPDIVMAKMFTLARAGLGNSRFSASWIPTGAGLEIRLCVSLGCRSWATNEASTEDILRGIREVLGLTIPEGERL